MEPHTDLFGGHARWRLNLMATKVKVVLQRAEAKDYRDVAAMVNAGASLSHGLASARQLYGPNFQPSESLKALVYFNDGDLKTLTTDEKNTLVEAVKAVRDLPNVALRANSLSGLSWKDLSVVDAIGETDWVRITRT